VLITVLRVSRSCELFPGGFDLHLLRQVMDLVPRGAEVEEVGEGEEVNLLLQVVEDQRQPEPDLPSAYLRLIDSCITQRKAQGPSRTCNESKEEEEV